MPMSSSVSLPICSREISIQPRQPNSVRVGTAGWSIPRSFADHFHPEGTPLERYSRRSACVEINSSFYRPHQPRTYERWRAATPPNFKFSLKMPKLITHELKLRDAYEPLKAFLDETAA